MRSRWPETEVQTPAAPPASRRSILATSAKLTGASPLNRFFQP